MPLTDRPEFQTWFERRQRCIIGRSHDNPNVCIGCGNPLDHPLDSEECLVCLAEHFGTETAELWLAQAITSVIRAAADPQMLSPLLAELVKFTRELTDIHAPPDQGTVQG